MWRILGIIAIIVIVSVVSKQNRTKYYCPYCGSEDFFYNSTKNYVLFCDSCKKFGKFLPPDSYGKFRKSCCNGEFQEEDSKIMKHYGCNSCKKTFEKPITNPKESKEYQKNNGTEETDEKGNKYKGSIDKQGEKNGYGVMNYKNGDTYEGDWVNGKKEGSGTYNFKNGDVYTGEFKNNRRYGWGTHTFKDGRRVSGFFEDGEVKYEKGLVLKYYPKTDTQEFIFEGNTYTNEQDFQRAWKRALKKDLGIYTSDEFEDVSELHDKYLKSKHIYTKNTVELASNWLGRETHCWKCAKYLTSKYNYKCKLCGRLICRKCGSCGCGIPKRVYDKIGGKSKF